MPLSSFDRENFYGAHYPEQNSPGINSDEVGSILVAARSARIACGAYRIVAHVGAVAERRHFLALCQSSTMRQAGNQNIDGSTINQHCHGNWVFCVNLIYLSAQCCVARVFSRFRSRSTTPHRVRVLREVQHSKHIGD